MKAKYFIAPNESGIFCGEDNIARIDSRTVAEAFGKRHEDVLEEIENIDCSAYFRQLNFELSAYTDKDGKSCPCYTMTREGFTYLARRYIKGEYSQIRKEFFKRFDKMESLINHNLSEKYA
jgi:Rha family phage regulatory protein